jgi:hypothetical protein
MVILDPNSDYVHLSRGTRFCRAAVAAEYAAAASAVAVWQSWGHTPAQLRFTDIDSAARAAVFGLDPIRDREEYAALAGILAASERAVRSSAAWMLSCHLSRHTPTRLARSGNLGVFDWSIWSGSRGRSLVDELEEPTTLPSH